MTYGEIRAWAVGQRDALNEVIASLDRLMGMGPASGVVMESPKGPTVEETVATVRAHRRVAETPNGNGVSHRAVVARPDTAAREASVIGALTRAGGMANRKQILASFVTEPGWDEWQRKDAFRNTMSKLKAKGIVGRTGETWSVVEKEGE